MWKLPPSAAATATEGAGRTAGRTAGRGVAAVVGREAGTGSGTAGGGVAAVVTGRSPRARLAAGASSVDGAAPRVRLAPVTTAGRSRTADGGGAAPTQAGGATCGRSSAA